jgi:hypothetical protein
VVNTTIPVILLLLAFWAGGILFVAWDTGRRNMPGYQRSLWRVLVVIPLLGLAAYLIARAFLPAEAGVTAAAPRGLQGRVTILKPDAPKRLPTIPAAEYLRAAQPAYQPAARRADRAAAPQETIYMVAAEGPHAGEKFVISRFPALIGRGAGCAICLEDDQGVSRRHAELYQRASKVHLRDLGSTHGTTVNGVEVNDEGLVSGDEIRLGYSRLVFKTERQER